MHSESGSSTFIVVCVLALLVVGLPLGSFLIDYMQGVQRARIENQFGPAIDDLKDFQGPPDGYEPGGFTITFDL